MQRCYGIDLDYKERWQYNKTPCNVFLKGAKPINIYYVGNFLNTQREEDILYTDQENEVRLESFSGGQ